MDFLVDDQEVDAKWTMTSGAWMIPTEAVGRFAYASLPTTIARCME